MADQGMTFAVQFGEAIEYFLIPWTDLYWVKQTFVCDIAYGHIILE